MCLKKHILRYNSNLKFCNSVLLQIMYVLIVRVWSRAILRFSEGEFHLFVHCSDGVRLYVGFLIVAVSICCGFRNHKLSCFHIRFDFLIKLVSFVF